MTSRPAVVGGFILGALALGVAGILFFGGMRLFATSTRVVVFFSESLAGLDVGSPVTFHGVRVGSVQSMALVYSTETMTARTPVFLELERNKVILEGTRLNRYEPDFEQLVRAGLRAQLALQSFVTGQLRVDLDVRPGTPAQLVGAAPGVPEIPALPSELGQLRNELTQLRLRELADTAQRAFASVGHLSDHLDATLDPLAQSAHRTLDAATQTLQTTNEAVRRVQADASTTLRDLDSLIVDAHGQLGARGGELSRALTTADRTLRHAETLIELAKWSCRASLAIPRRSRSHRTRSRRQRQLPAQLRGNDRAEPERPPHGSRQPMKQAAARSSPGTRFFWVAVLAFFGAAMCGITACSLSGPPPAEYVLGAMPVASATTLSANRTAGRRSQAHSGSRLSRHNQYTGAQRQSARPELDQPLGRTAVGWYGPSSHRLACHPAAPPDGDRNAGGASGEADPARCGCL